MFIYLIHCRDTNRYKIGITNRSIESRLNELNGSQAAYPLDLVMSIRHTNYKAVERHLHEKYAANRIHNEWFTFSLEQLVEVKNYMQSFDTPLSGFKPILKPQSHPQPIVSSFRLPGRGWILPLLIGLGIVMMCRQCEFLQPATVSPHQSETMRIDRK